MDYIYYKLFRLQEKVGNGDIAHVAAAIMMGFLCLVTLLAILWILIAVSLNPPLFLLNPTVIFFTILFFSSLVYFKFGINKKYRVVIANYENESVRQRRLGTFYVALWPISLVLVMVTLVALRVAGIN